jgi:dTDP-4-amino-4,6-dideoxygalactose transaminase
MADGGLGAGIHHRIPLHLLRAYKCLDYGAVALPIFETIPSEILTLVMFPQLAADQQAHVVIAVEALGSIGGPLTRTWFCQKFYCEVIHHE